MKNKLLSLILIFSCIGLTACGTVTEADTDRVYECDVKFNPFQTKIITEFNGSEVTIKGDILKFVEDPLEMVDSDDNILANAGDDFNIINHIDNTIIAFYSSSGSKYICSRSRLSDIFTRSSINGLIYRKNIIWEKWKW